MTKLYFVSPEKCRALALTVMAETEYDAILAATRHCNGDVTQLKALFAEKFPHYELPGKRGIGRHPDTQLAFLVLEALDFKNGDMTKVMSWKKHDAVNLRQVLLFATRLTDLDNYTVNRGVKGEFRHRSASTRRLLPQRCKELALTVIEEQVYERFLSEIKNIADIDAVRTFFDKNLPDWRTPGKAGIGQHPEFSIAFLLLESIECKRIAQITGRSRDAEIHHRKTLTHLKQLISAQDFTASRRKTGFMRSNP